VFHISICDMGVKSTKAPPPVATGLFKLIDNFACLKARKKFVIDCELLDVLVANIWSQLMQIIMYLPSSSWLWLLVLARLPVVKVSNVLYRKTQSSGVARHFDLSDQKHGYLLMNIKKYSQSGVILLQWLSCSLDYARVLQNTLFLCIVFYSKGRILQLYKISYLNYQWWVSVVKVVVAEHQ